MRAPSPAPAPSPRTTRPRLQPPPLWSASHPAPWCTAACQAQRPQELADARARDAALLLPLTSRVMSVAADAMGVDEAEAEAALFEPPSVEDLLGSPQRPHDSSASVPVFIAAMDRAFHHFHRAVRGVSAVRSTVGARMARLVAQVETLTARAAIVQAATEQDLADVTGEHAADDAGPSLLDLMDQCHEAALEQCERAEELARRAAHQLTAVGPEERALHVAVGDVGAEARTLAATVATIRAELDASIVRALRERMASPQASKTAGSMVARAMRARGGGGLGQGPIGGPGSEQGWGAGGDGGGCSSCGDPRRPDALPRAGPLVPVAAAGGRGRRAGGASGAAGSTSRRR